MTTAVVLAAGMSKRFGKQKLEYVYKKKPLLQWTLDLVNNLNFRKILIVSKSLDISKFNLDDFKVAINEKTERGLSSSVKLAIMMCERKKEDEGALFFLGDMPEIDLKLVKRVLSFDTSHIVFPTFGGVKGFPVFLPSSYFDEARKIKGDSGLISVIKDHKKECISFEGGWKCVYDVDTIDDLKNKKG